MTSLPEASSRSDVPAPKQQQQALWARGNYQEIGTRVILASELLCEAVGIRAGERVLDVASGTGNTALAAARRFAYVTSTDFVPELLERGKMRSQAEGLPMTFEVADAEQLPFPDGSFDVVLSTFGVMFAPDQEQVASELLRVCRSGGRIGLANWTPDGFVGEQHRTLTKYLPAPPGVKPPTLWGTEERLRELFGDAAATITIEQRDMMFRYHSAQQFVSFMRSHFGPFTTVFESLDPAAQEQLSAELVSMAERYNRSGNHTIVVPSSYLEVTMVRN